MPEDPRPMGAGTPASATPVKHTHIGGQALLEGVMMRGKLNWAVAVRTPDGTVHVEAHDFAGGKPTGWKVTPILRGMWALYETLSLSMKAFAVAARWAGTGEEEEQLTSSEIGWTMGLGLLIAVAAFIVAPALLTNLLVGSSLARPVLWNVVDGVLRVGVFFAYLWGVGRMPDIRRVFAYHGAEHKSIHAFEHGEPLDPAHVQKHETLHVRCGTSFLLMVMIVAIVVFSLVPGKAILGYYGVDSAAAVVAFNILVRILLLPLVAGLAYEVSVKWAGNHSDNVFVRALMWPGMQLQRMTTREPDDGMVEVAIAALSAVVAREAGRAVSTETA